MCSVCINTVFQFIWRKVKFLVSLKNDSERTFEGYSVQLRFTNEKFECQSGYFIQGKWSVTKAELDPGLLTRSSSQCLSYLA